MRARTFLPSRAFGQSVRFIALAIVAMMAAPETSRAYITQTDGTIVPLSNRLQMCLDDSELSAGAVNAVSESAVLPEAYRPVPNAAGRYVVTFTDLAEGGGFRNTFGWYWIGTDVTQPANLFPIFGCRTYNANGTACPCGACTNIRTVTVDFTSQPGFSAGRPIGFWLRTPEKLDGTREAGTAVTACDFNTGCLPTMAGDDRCGSRWDVDNRIYFTSQALNDDGDYVHFLVLASATRTDTFYFGFEDLFRGGDNDFEDMLVRAGGLVPECDPQPESCNNSDDDCDGQVDENLTMACTTMCGAGLSTCRMGRYGTCDARTPGTETCNNIDDDCDTSIDEGLSRACSNACGSGREICIEGTYGGCNARTPALETCNGTDDDCDGRTDENLTRSCATDCGSGTEQCTGGSYSGCSAPMPAAEMCDGVDNDCDGRFDEALVRDCTNSCGTGTEQCLSGSWRNCSAPTTIPEACNGRDDDCDGMTDENLVQACSSACGLGERACVGGSYQDCVAPVPMAEECNNRDDDCNGVIDDGNPGGGARCIPLPGGGFTTEINTGTAGTCAPGTVRCIGGALVCQGGATGSREVCNCIDDDCDGQIDENAAGDLCPGGACNADECACVSPCADGEFPCPVGRFCDRTGAVPPAIGYCVAGACAGVNCPINASCDPMTGECIDQCTGVNCAPGATCRRGLCVEDNCYGLGCASGEVCRTSELGDIACETNACLGVVCDGSAYCVDGQCVAVCAEPCEAGEICADGECVAAPCDGACGPAEACIDDRCVANDCDPRCGRGRVCRGDRCVDDPCSGIVCPATLECREGVCADPSNFTPRLPVRGLAAGGGCTCRVGTGGASSGTTPWVGFGLLAMVIAGRRRRRGAARVSVLVVATSVVGAVALSGCDVEPYCFANCGDEVDSGIPPEDTGVNVPDGCVPNGTDDDQCDNEDNDCDGRADEGFDFSDDLRNCGACNARCDVSHAFPACIAGQCEVSRCEIGWVDLNNDPVDGCEYSCPPGGDEVCDGTDNDCDGRTDEGVNLQTDLGNCGSCGFVCTFANAEAACEAGTCRMGACRTGYQNANGATDDGCEYPCTATGTETCNAADDDCDDRVDEGIDFVNDATNCGTCGRTCMFPNSNGRCSMGDCIIGPGDCFPGFLDLDRDLRNGCEYACTPTGRADVCDNVDDDCDGRLDEADPMLNAACGPPAVGVCRPGVVSCVRGMLDCAGDRTAQMESCNNLDDDCDGRTDESTAAAPIPGLGDRCGATNTGACEYGTVRCVAGVTVCGGGVSATTETCNGIDDDCDGVIDDTLTPPAVSTIPSCAETRGVCAGRRPTCRGTSGWACDLPTNYQATETLCDTLDNDCDGTRDEGCLSPVGSDQRIDTQYDSVFAQSSLYNSSRPVVAASGAQVQIAWNEAELIDGAMDPPIYYTHVFGARSSDNGGAFATPVRLNTGNGDTFGPQVTSNGTESLFLWADFRGGTNYREIWTRRWVHATGTPATAVRVNPSVTFDAYGVQVARNGTTIHAVWEGFVSTRSRHIYHARSSDSGATWGAPTQVSQGTGASFIAATPRLAVAGSNVYVVWRDNRSGSLDVFVRRSTDAGATFFPEVRVDTGTAAGSSSSFSPDVAAEGSNAYIVWVDDRDRGSFDIWASRSITSGATWLAPVKLDNDAFDHDSIEPHVISTGSGRASIAWLDYRSGLPDPFIVNTSDAGATFSTPQRLDTATSPGASGSYDLALAGAGNMLAAAWSDDRSGLLDIYLSYSLDGGATWQRDVRLDSSTAGSSDSQRPSLAVANNRIHAVWVDHRRGTACPNGFFLSSSCANGDVFYRRLQ